MRSRRPQPSKSLICDQGFSLRQRGPLGPLVEAGRTQSGRPQPSKFSKETCEQTEGLRMHTRAEEGVRPQ